jgi:hypothetical protein
MCLMMEYTSRMECYYLEPLSPILFSMLLTRKMKLDALMNPLFSLFLLLWLTLTTR